MFELNNIVFISIYQILINTYGNVSECYNHLFDVISLYFREFITMNLLLFSYLSSMNGLKFKGGVMEAETVQIYVV